MTLELREWITKLLLGVFIAFLACVALGAWSTYDYGLRCAKCLAERGVVEQQLFGVTISRRINERTAPTDYERIFGHPCQHVFRKGGFGRGSHSLLGSGIGCGTTGEGMFVRPRMEAVSATYDAERRFQDHSLTLATFQLIDTLMPADAEWQPRGALPQKTQDTIFQLGTYLRRVKTVEQWRAVLDAARQNFSDTSSLSTQ